MRDELAADDISLVVVVLPLMDDLLVDDPDSTHTAHLRSRLLAVVNGLNLPVIDAWDVVLDAIRTQGPRRIFVYGDGPQPDHHFNPEGHRFFARWLGRQLAGVQSPSR